MNAPCRAGRLLSFVLIAILSGPARGAEANRERTSAREPPALSLLTELRVFQAGLPEGGVLGVDLEFGLDYRSPGAFRCSFRCPLSVRAAFDGIRAGRADAAFGDPSLEAGVSYRRGGSVRSLGAGYAAPLGSQTAEAGRPLRPSPGAGCHRFSLAAGWGRVRDPAALALGISWSASFPISGDPFPIWRPADIGLSFTLAEVVNDTVGILFGLSPLLLGPALGPGAGPASGIAWGLEARVEVHLRTGRFFLRTGLSRSLADPAASARVTASAEYEFRIGPEPGGGG